MQSYDLVTMGGGLAGSALAFSLARAGARVLVVERERAFRDRVRGEGLLPWGVVEARALGVYDLVRDSCGHEVPSWIRYLDGAPVERRDLLATTRGRAPVLDFYHPAMQERLSSAAAGAGATVRRGARVVGIAPGAMPEVTLRVDGREEQVRARLVAGADGRTSRARGLAGFPVRREPECMRIAGILLDDVPVDPDAVHFLPDVGGGQLVILFPLGAGQVRAYYAWRTRGERRVLSGRAHVRDFVEASVAAGAPARWYESARPAGPLAMFDGAHHWVGHPHHAGVVLVGDAAACADPTFGCGLGLTLRDVRTLRDALLGSEDWQAAADAYAVEHDRYASALRRIEDWLTRLFYDLGPEADARRARALPMILADPERIPDLVGLGPDAPSDEAARRRLFGEA